MKSIKLNLILLAVLAIAFSSCKKEEDDHSHDSTSDTSKPVITISSPVSTAMYNNGDTIKIRGKVTDNSLHELLIKVVNDANGAVLYSTAPTVHDLTTYSFSVDWKSSVTDHTNASIIVLAEDHSSNVSSDTVHVHIMP
ncbi:MAG TPA: hypothetical protein VGF79_05265 [Bacteroidia bacterium]